MKIENGETANGLIIVRKKQKEKIEGETLLKLVEPQEHSELIVAAYHKNNSDMR
jgi:hypothetical protein